MTSLYIYYRVQTPDQVHLAQAVHSMQARLRGAMPGLAASLHRRIDEPRAEASSDTWVEVYHFNGHADERAWARLDESLALEVGQLPQGIEGLRHAERFEAMTLRPSGVR